VAGVARRAERQCPGITEAPVNAQGRRSPPPELGRGMTSDQLLVVGGLAFFVYFFWLANKGK